MSDTNNPKHPFEEEGITDLGEVTEYERQKIEATIADLEATARALRIYLAYADAAKAKGVKIINQVSLLGLRIEGGPAGPHNDIQAIQVLAQNASSRAEESIKKAKPETKLTELRSLVNQDVVEGQRGATRAALEEFNKFNK